jgi:hypothetical protein
LNDLKDFEDVTFDNLRKPGDEPQNDSKAKNFTKPSVKMEHSKQMINQQQKQFYKQQKLKLQQQLTNNLIHSHLSNNGHLDTVNNSEQSLLLKSSSSSDDKSCSSANTINNINLNLINGGSNGQSSESASSSPLSSNSPNQEIRADQKDEETRYLITDHLKHHNGVDRVVEKINQDQNSKIYEETEI